MAVRPSRSSFRSLMQEGTEVLGAVVVTTVGAETVGVV